MANLGMAFDSNQHEDMGNFDPIPAGDYIAKTISSEMKDTKNKDGKYLKLEFEVIQGEFKGRKIWQQLNLVNKSQQTVEIAKKELATLCRAVGKPVIQDSAELHGIPLTLKVKFVPANGDYAASNKPSGYAPAGGNGPAAAPTGVANPAKKLSNPAGATAQDAAEPAVDGEIPWGQK